MKILTQEILDAFAKQGKTGNKSAREIKIVLKLFNPTGAGTWYLYEKIDNDTYMCFANLEDIDCAECGTVSMSELLEFKGLFGLGIERDKFFKPLSITLQEVIDKVKSGGHI
jgi:hypothetical protein